MRGLFVLLCLGVGLVSSAHAAITVGKLDGAAAPALPAVETPALGHMVEEKLADSGYPMFLEDIGMWREAAAAWLQLAYQGVGDARGRALLKAAEDFGKAGDSATADRLYRALSGPEGQACCVGEALFRRAQTAPLREQASLAADLQARGGEWRERGLYELVWRTAAGDGPVRQTYGLGQAETLKARLAAADRQLVRRETMAGILGLMPGFGHAWLGKATVAAAVLPLWGLLGWLVLWSTRRRQWPYAVMWGVLLAFVWVSSPLLAMQEAHLQNRKVRGQMMAGWHEFKPVAAPETVPVLVEVPKETSETLSETVSVTEAPVLPSATVTTTEAGVDKVHHASPKVAVKKGDVFKMTPTMTSTKAGLE